MKNWYEKTAQQTLDELSVSVQGLSAEEAARRLEKHGENKLTEGRKKSALQVFAEQFKDLLVIILVAAALISLASGQSESTLVIFAVLLLNAVLGTVQYLKAEKSLESLKAMSAPTAKVLRGGETVALPSAQVVPGDVVLLEAGDMVVADGRLLNSWSLKINESSLTGDSEPVEKVDGALEGENIPLGDRRNMAYSGSLVTYGRGLMVVTETGMDTEIGHIAALMNRTQQRKTPLQQSLDAFSGKLAAVIMAICGVVFLLSVFRSGMPVLDSLMFAVALAVAAIPEALSSIVTIVLAMGTQKMARQNAVIKDLKAVESLGAVSVICSDKTGTLTQNRMQVQKAWVAGEELEAADMTAADPAQTLLGEMGLLASDATMSEEGAVGDPTEIALVQLGRGMGMNEHALRSECPRLGELAFDSDRKLMSTLHRVDGERTLYTKGAMDELLARSARSCPGRRAPPHRGGQSPAGGRERELVPPGAAGAGLRPPAAGRERASDHGQRAGLHLCGPCGHGGPAPSRIHPGGGGRPPRRHPHHHDHRRPQGHRQRHRRPDRHHAAGGPGAGRRGFDGHDRRAAGRGAAQGVGLRPRLAGAQDPHRGGLAAPGQHRVHDR